MSIASLSATELARRIRQGDLSSVEVVEAHIARIETVNPAINAVVTPRFEQARREAAAADAVLSRGGHIGPLHGVPFTAKDCFDTAHVRTTCGLTARADHVPTADAFIVKRLRDAGAILLGKTNLPDNCWDQETNNLLFGRTNNPWDTRRTVGGSTGGEAAIIAAGGSPLGIGSDIAGSIRMPAHFTRIVGLRPTSAGVSEAGFWPPSSGRLADLNAIGPMARRVEDVALAFDVLYDRTPRPLDVGRLQGEPVAYWFSDGVAPSSKAIRNGVRAAVTALQAVGMRAVERAPGRRRFAVLGWLAWHGQPEREAISRGFGNGEAWSPVRELARHVRRGPRVTLGALYYWLLSHYGSLLADRLVNAARWRERLQAQLWDLTGEGGVAVCPIFPTAAPRHGWTFPRNITTVGYQVWVNLAGLPGLTVPVGQTKRELPVGVQIVGMPGTERTILAAGLAVQQSLMPDWVGPPL